MVELQAFTDRSITTAAALKEDLATIRAQGFPVDNEDEERGHAMHCCTDLRYQSGGGRRDINFRANEPGKCGRDRPAKPPPSWRRLFS